MKRRVVILAMGLVLFSFSTSCGEQTQNDNTNKTSEAVEESSTPEESLSPDESSIPEDYQPTSKIAMSLEDLSDGEKFNFGDTWNLTLSETEEKIGMKLEAMHEIGNVKNYRIPDDVYFVEAERDAIMGMQFIDDKMQMVALSIKESDSDIREQLYQKLCEKIKSLYGEPDRNEIIEEIGDTSTWIAESEEEKTMMGCENNAKAEEVTVLIHFVP